MQSPANTQFELSEIGQIAAAVYDLARAITFYKDTLGMKFLFQAPPGLGFFDCGGPGSPRRGRAHDRRGRQARLPLTVLPMGGGLRRSIAASGPGHGSG